MSCQPNLLFRWLVLASLTLLSFTSLWSQEMGGLQVDIDHGKDSLVFRWFPTSPASWGRVRTGGYRIERFTIDSSEIFGFDEVENPNWEALTFGRRGIPIPDGNTVFKLADSLTMRMDSLAGNGYVGAMATMLYDSAFNDGNDLAGVLKLQYEMAAFGAMRLSEKAGAYLGARVEVPGLDTTATYLFRITAVDDPSVREEIAVNMAGRHYKRYNAYVDVDYQNNPFAGELPPVFSRYRFSALGKAFSDSIVVRWAPLDATLLRKSHELGYLVQKSKMIPGGPGESPTYEAIGSPLNVWPWTKAEFAAYLSKSPIPDSLVLVSAQVLYGALQTEGDLDRQTALENQLAYGLQVADQSALAANALGLRYVDYAVEPGVTYVYSIEMPMDSIDPNSYPVNGSVLLENNYYGPEEIASLTALEGEYVISLVMPKENGENYNQYYIERSADNGSTWTALSNKPIVFETDEKLVDEVRYYFYPDSVATLYQPFRYRLRGRNVFQEYSPWAELTAMARDRTPPPVAIPGDPEMLTTEIVRLSWDGEMSATAPDLAGYYVKMGHFSSVENQPIVSELLPVGMTTWDYVRPGLPFTNDSSYFFQVAAVDTAGNMSNSFPVALRVIDSIPPAPPTGLLANLDTNGVVTLLWEASPEKDAAGYQVYFANDTTENFVQITKADLQYNYFKDTIVLNTLNEAIYYRVSAFDRSYNNSEWSDILRVERPDIVPPTPPVLLLPRPTGEAVVLTWKRSSSTDAVTYAILRRDAADESGQWSVLDSIPAIDTLYADTTAAYEVVYDYTMHTVDDAGLASEQANIQAGRRIFTADVGGVGEVTVALQGTGEQARPQVQWTYEKPGEDLLSEADHRFMLYRATGNAPLLRYKQLKSKEPSFTDTAVEAGQTYRYALMVVYSNGKKSGLSMEQSVTIPKEGE